MSSRIVGLILMVFAGFFIYLYDTGKADLVKTLLVTGTLPPDALKQQPLAVTGILASVGSAALDILKRIQGTSGGDTGSGGVQTPPIAGN